MSLLSEVSPVMAVLEHPHGLLEAPRFGPGAALLYSDVIAGGDNRVPPERGGTLLQARSEVAGLRVGATTV
jgi:hypothetical protein